MLYLYPGSKSHFLLWSVQIEGSDLTLDFTVECGFPKLLVGPDGMVLNAGVGKLVDPWSQFLNDKNTVVCLEAKSFPLAERWNPRATAMTHTQ